MYGTVVSEGIRFLSLLIALHLAIVFPTVILILCEWVFCPLDLKIHPYGISWVTLIRCEPVGTAVGRAGSDIYCWPICACYRYGDWARHTHLLARRDWWSCHSVSPLVGPEGQAHLPGCSAFRPWAYPKTPVGCVTCRDAEVTKLGAAELSTATGAIVSGPAILLSVMCNCTRVTPSHTVWRSDTTPSHVQWL